MTTTILFVCIVALVASTLTFFSGFGLGTLLLPAFSLFFSVEEAVALTAIVHFLNGLFKAVLVGRHADSSVIVKFGLPAVAASFVGAGLLVWLSGLAPVLTYTLSGHTMHVTPVKLAVGVLLLAFSAGEIIPKFAGLSFDARHLPLGGLMSGFFGGLSGTQGALRAAFLVRTGLSKEAFIGTGVLLALMVDIARLGVYSSSILLNTAAQNSGLLFAAVLSAFCGAWLGNHYLKKVTLRGVQRVVALTLMVFAVLLAGGVL